MRLRFKKLHPDAKAPYLGTPFSAGFDLTAVSVEHDAINDVDIYGTGLAVEIPKGYYGQLALRSSSFRSAHRPSTGVGVIDADFRSEIKVFVDRRQGEHPEFRVGDRIAQLIIQPCWYEGREQWTWEESDELSETKRGAGGYGSTGR